MPRQCPVCEQDSIKGHGRRSKQAHDQQHDWIDTRRGVCKLCGKSFTFLPCFSLPYTHYSLLARSDALRRRFVEGQSWEASAPTVKDPDRVAAPSTLRRWARSLDDSEPPFSRVRQTLTTISQWLVEGKVVRHGALRLSWSTVVPFLRQRWPWPLRL
jgi:hypothetical protein